MDLSIIIPTIDREKIFEETINSVIDATEGINAEIIVINDSDHDLINNNYPEKVLILKNRKKGVAAARNLGAKYSKSNIILFIDDDIIITKKNIDATLSFFANNTITNICINLNWKYPETLECNLKKTAFGRYLIHYGFTSLEGKGWLNHTFDNRDNWQKIDGAASFYLAIRKNNFEKIGGYNESFSLSGFEDYDFAKKLRSNHIDCYILPSSYVFHNEKDRLILDQWMARRYRAGITRREGVKVGHEELKLKINIIKIFAYRLLVIVNPLLSVFHNLIPNNKYFDFVNFKIINVILGTSIFRGYYNK